MNSKPITEYVAGFMFSEDKSRVALIRKNKPAWQRGLLNGIGGKVEPGEFPWDAMTREFRDETGVTVECKRWKHYCTMHGMNDDGERFRVHFYAAMGDLSALKSKTSEQIMTFPVGMFRLSEMAGCVVNLPWLMALALDHLDDGRPGFVTAWYPAKEAA